MLFIHETKSLSALETYSLKEILAKLHLWGSFPSNLRFSLKFVLIPVLMISCTYPRWRLQSNIRSISSRKVPYRSLHCSLNNKALKIEIGDHSMKATWTTCDTASHNVARFSIRFLVCWEQLYEFCVYFFRSLLFKESREEKLKMITGRRFSAVAGVEEWTSD